MTVHNDEHPSGSVDGYDPTDPQYRDAQQRFLTVASQRGFAVRYLNRPTESSQACWANRLFMDRPKQWGLRGDPWLWRELHETTALIERPPSSDRAAELLKLALRELAGVDFDGDAPRGLSVNRYPVKGMSGGMVCPPKWVDELLPLLLDRFQESIADD